jgi:hypothetical protein
LKGGVTMIIASRRNKVEEKNVLGKIKVEGKQNEGQEVIVRHETAPLKWKGFESYLVMWTKIGFERRGD